MSRPKTMQGAKMRAVMLDDERISKLAELERRYNVSRSFLIRQAVDEFYDRVTRPTVPFPFRSTA